MRKQGITTPRRRGGWLERMRHLGNKAGRLAEQGEGQVAGSRQLRREEGSALVETAVSISVFLLALFAIVEFGFAIYTYNLVSNAARIATRYAVVRGSNSCVIQSNFPNCNLTTSTPLQTYVQGLGYPGINSNNLTVNAMWLSPGTTSGTWVTCAGICNNPGDAVQVTVNYNFPLMIPFWKTTTLTVSSTSVMEINN